MSIQFEGREVPIQPGDTLASALYRDGVRVFSRSFKYHRPRGLYCLSGDCPNCLVTVDGEVNVRACMCTAEDGQTVSRQNAWPSVDKDALNIIDKGHFLMPVGFYYKAGIKPKFAWPMAEGVIRRVAGLGFSDKSDAPRDIDRINRHPDVLVIGAGVAGLSAALAAAEGGKRVMVIDEQAAPGDRVAQGPTKQQIDALAATAAQNPGIEVLPGTAAIGIYEGPMVLALRSDQVMHIHPQAIVIASGGMEIHRIFPGNDLPGVFMARGAARLAGAHGVKPGDVAVVWAETQEAVEHARTLQAAGVRVACVVTAPGVDAQGVGERQVEGEVVEAKGKKKVQGAIVRAAGGATEEVACDLLAVGAEIQQNMHLPRLAYDLPCVLAGDAALPGSALDVAAQSGTQAGQAAAQGLPLYVNPPASEPRPCGTAGYVCICEDVSVAEVEQAIDEGFESAELLKRYTTVTMGPCQGRLCADQLRAIAHRKTPAEAARVAAPTTLRPPVRPIKMEQAAAGARHHIERHTPLHQKHLEMGASTLWAGPWKRIFSYGDMQAEYEAVRHRVGVIDVGTLGKFLLAGPDVVEFLERIYPMRVADLEPGRLRYGLMLEEGGVIIDDGTVCALEGGAFYCTVTTSGAERLESWMLDWKEAWGLDVFVVNQTASLAAVNVAGPHARDLLEQLTDDPIDKEAFPYLRHRRITVNGVSCLAIRLGFVGELAYELHFPAAHAVEMWDAILEAGKEWDIKPFGLDAQRLLRLEKGHIIISQDTDFETTPWKVSMDWAVKLDKPEFVGKAALIRAQRRTPREMLVPWKMDPGMAAPPEGSTVTIGGNLAGRVTSSKMSYVLGHPVGLAWVTSEHATEGGTITIGGAPATIGGHAFYDPEGVKLRA
ncbi:MAG: 2Fe-2S iron-sulfur cluster-binding protein [Actinomycetota bacterium]